MTDAASEHDDQFDLPYDPRDWIAASEAFNYLTSIVGSSSGARAFARALIFDALSGDALSARAKALRQEWEIGPARSVAAKHGRYVIETMTGTNIGMIGVDQRHFSRSPKGARTSVNWKMSRFVWIGPPGRTFRNDKTGEFGRVAAKRIVMLGVVFRRRDFIRLADKQRTNIKRINVRRANGLSITLVSKFEWESKLQKYYTLANNGLLRQTYRLTKHGKKTEFARTLMAEIEGDRTNTSRERTYVRQVEALIIRDIERGYRANDGESGDGQGLSERD